MPVFESWSSYRRFESAIKREQRYIRSEEVENFLHAVVATSESRRHDITEGKCLWRAQLGHDWRQEDYEGESHEIPCPHRAERMKPPVGKAFEGRANPKGIPYLYLSTDKDTAMSEVRPPVGSLVSVGQFKMLRDLMVIDCSVNHAAGFGFYFKEPEPEERERAVWREIDRAFAAPVNNSDDIADYVPTQIIAELFKDKGYDGIAFKSSLGKGYNVALYEIGAAEIIFCQLFEVKSVDFVFEEVANPWFRK